VEKKIRTHPYPQLPQQRPPHAPPPHGPSHGPEKQHHTPPERIGDRGIKRFNDESQGSMESLSRRSDHSMPPSKRRHMLEPPAVGKKPVDKKPVDKKPVDNFSVQQSLSPTSKQNRTIGLPEHLTNSGKESPRLPSRLSNASSGAMPARMPESIQKKV
jgi:hypothetical protein